MSDQTVGNILFCIAVLMLFSVAVVGCVKCATTFSDNETFRSCVRQHPAVDCKRATDN